VGDADGLHLGVGDLDALVIDAINEMRLYPESGPGLGVTDVFEYGLVAVQRSSRPVLGDLAEQAVLDGVPLRGTRRVVGDSDGDAVAVREPLLEPVLPRSTVRAVAAAAIGQDGELLGSFVPAAALGDPPRFDGIDGEFRRVSGGTDKDGPLVGRDVIDPVGDRPADGVGWEVVVENLDGLLTPGRPRVLERSDQLLLLGVDADEGPSARCAVLSDFCDVRELRVAIHGRRLADPGQLLVVDPK